MEKLKNTELKDPGALSAGCAGLSSNGHTLRVSILCFRLYYAAPSRLSGAVRSEAL